MFSIGVQSEFSAAHFHRGAAESCERIHGHNYRVEVQVSSPRLQEDMVIDFEIVRRAMAKTIEPWDHQLLNKVADFTGVPPTTENISRLFFNQLSPLLPESITLRKVTVWETGDCWASYSMDDGESS